MELSFYTAAVGATSQQEKLDVIANNMANANTYGYKAKNPVFSDLLYSNMNAAENAQSNLKAGSGVRLEKTDISMEQGTLATTGAELDFAIIGQGYFGLLNPATQEVSYTRDGSFSLSRVGDDFYLASATGKWVMGPDQQPIVIKKAVPGEGDGKVGAEEYGENDSIEDILKKVVQQVEIEEGNGELNIGLFSFSNQNGILSAGNNEFVPVEKNGEPIAITATQENLQRGALERSNVEVADQFSQIIEAQRAYQYALRMVQTSDEVVATVNGLRS